MAEIAAAVASFVVYKLVSGGVRTKDGIRTVLAIDSWFAFWRTSMPLLLSPYAFFFAQACQAVVGVCRKGRAGSKVCPTQPVPPARPPTRVVSLPIPQVDPEAKAQTDAPTKEAAKDDQATRRVSLVGQRITAKQLLCLIKFQVPPPLLDQLRRIAGLAGAGRASRGRGGGGWVGGGVGGCGGGGGGSSTQPEGSNLIRVVDLGLIPAQVSPHFWFSFLGDPHFSSRLINNHKNITPKWRYYKYARSDDDGSSKHSEASYAKRTYRADWEPAAASEKCMAGVPGVFWRSPAVLWGPSTPNPTWVEGKTRTSKIGRVSLYACGNGVNLPHVAKHAFGDQMGPNMQKAMPFGSPPQRGLNVRTFKKKYFRPSLGPTGLLSAV